MWAFKKKEKKQRIHTNILSKWQLYNITIYLFIHFCFTAQISFENTEQYREQYNIIIICVKWPRVLIKKKIIIKES